MKEDQRAVTNGESHRSAAEHSDSSQRDCESVLSLRIVLSALSRMEWLRSFSEPSVGDTVSDESQPDCCFLRRVLELDAASGSIRLTAVGRACLTRMVDAGFSLMRAEDCRADSRSARWLGERLAFGLRSNFGSPASPLTALVSSRLGKFGSHLPTWPRLLEKIMRWHVSRGRRLLIADQSSLGKLAQPMAARLDRHMILLRVASDSAPFADATSIEHVRQWLSQCLHQAGMRLDDRSPSNTIDLSPSFGPPEVTFTQQPAQDRAVVCMADEVHALHVRRGGAIEFLLRQRLTEEPRGAAGVFVTIDPDLDPSWGRAREQACVSDRFLDAGAVGWYLPPTAPLLKSRCRNQRQSGSCIQLQIPYRPSWFGDDRHADEPARYLIHCVRSNVGPRPHEDDMSFVDRIWQDGSLSEQHPIHTLLQILDDGLLRASAARLRTKTPCISFSSVPLEELVARRSFQSHLQHWDWEPYGLMIRREALERLGARPVLYGDESDYRELTEPDRVYFQPAKRRRSVSSDQDWEQEHEWRLAGDLKLSQLQHDDVLLIVSDRQQADMLSRSSRFAVTYLRAD